MAECAVCGKPGLVYAHVFVARKKVKSYPVCVTHAGGSFVFEQLAQEILRSNLAGMFGIKKGSIPRVKISLNP